MFVLLAKVLRTCDFVMAGTFWPLGQVSWSFCARTTFTSMYSVAHSRFYILDFYSCSNLLVSISISGGEWFQVFHHPECGPKIVNAAYILWLYRFCNCLLSRFAREQLRAPCILTQQLRLPCDSPAEADVQKAQNVAQHHSDLLSKKINSPSFQEILLRNNTVNVFMLAESRVPHTMLVFLLKAAC